MPKNYSKYQYVNVLSALKHVKVLIFKDKILLFRNFLLTCSRFFWNAIGEMLEWLKRHAWKACIRLKRIKGSNPFPSAIFFDI